MILIKSINKANLWISINMWLIKKSMQKINKFNVKQTLKNKIYNNHVI